MSKFTRCRVYVLALMSVVQFLSGSLVCQAHAAKSKSAPWHPGNYIYCVNTDPTDAELARLLAASSRFRGVQVMYTWRSCEPTKGNYNFSRIKKHLAMAKAANKHLFVQVQFKGFSPNPYAVCPNYLVSGSAKPGGGYYSAFFTQQIIWGKIKQPVTWDPTVQNRLLALYSALGTALSSDSNVSALEGVNLPETASPNDETLDSADNKNVMPKNKDVYNQNVVDRFKTLNAKLPHTQVLQYINFVLRSPSFPQMEASMLDKAIGEGVGMGGPDLRRWGASHTYRLCPDAAGKVPLGYAVQYLDTKHPGPSGGYVDNKISDVRDTYDFARDLKLNYVFWFGTTNYLNMVEEILSAPAIRTDPAGGLVKSYPNSITPMLH